MPVKVYCDGSVSGDGNLVTLTSFFGDHDAWAYFNREWAEMLCALGLKAFHATQVNSVLNEPERTRAFLRAFDVLMDTSNKNRHFRAATCSVVVSAFRQAQGTSIRLSKKTPEAICVDWCTGDIRISAADVGNDDCVTIYFDRNEKYLRMINAVHQRAKRMKSAGWPAQVVDILPVRSTQCSPIQAADLLAWCANRSFTKGDIPGFDLLRHAMPHDVMRYVSPEGLIQAYPDRNPI